MNAIKTFLLGMLLCSLPGQAQVATALTDKIQTLMVVTNGHKDASPVVQLGSDERVEISFDELSHDYRRLAYKIEHCNADWSINDALLESDFLDTPGDELLIRSTEQSMNTTVLYTHYAFSLPNADAELRLSGNYRVTIYDADEGPDTPLAYAYFSVSEALTPIAMQASTNTDVDWNATHQQLSLSINYNQMHVSDVRRQFKVWVLQNRRWDTAVSPPPTSVSGSALLWQHCRALIFRAGNEYRKMEMLDVHVPTLGVDNIRWHAPFYHFTLYPDAVRTNYLYDEDRDGGFRIRAANGNECDYVLTHFTLSAPERTDGDFYVCGHWANGSFDGRYRMQYDTASQAYRATVLLKQGYYNYMYLFLPRQGQGPALTQPAEGDFYQTENTYTAYAYFRDTGGRYDRLVGVTELRFRP